MDEAEEDKERVISTWCRRTVRSRPQHFYKNGKQ